MEGNSAKIEYSVLSLTKTCPSRCKSIYQSVFTYIFDNTAFGFRRIYTHQSAAANSVRLQQVKNLLQRHTLTRQALQTHSDTTVDCCYRLYIARTWLYTESG